jgi:hypothetical protein
MTVVEKATPRRRPPTLAEELLLRLDGLLRFAHTRESRAIVDEMLWRQRRSFDGYYRGAWEHLRVVPSWNERQIVCPECGALLGVLRHDPQSSMNDEALTRQSKRDFRSGLNLIALHLLNDAVCDLQGKRHDER